MRTILLTILTIAISTTAMAGTLIYIPEDTKAYKPHAADEAYREEDDRIQTRRSENAKAFREYVEAKVTNGETTTIEELESLRRQMAAGEPYLVSYVPSGKELREVVDRANERAALNRAKSHR